MQNEWTWLGTVWLGGRAGGFGMVWKCKQVLETNLRTIKSGWKNENNYEGRKSGNLGSGLYARLLFVHFHFVELISPKDKLIFFIFPFWCHPLTYCYTLRQKTFRKSSSFTRNWRSFEMGKRSLPHDVIKYLQLI